MITILLKRLFSLKEREAEALSKIRNSELQKTMNFSYVELSKATEKWKF